MTSRVWFEQMAAPAVPDAFVEFSLRFAAAVDDWGFALLPEAIVDQLPGRRLGDLADDPNLPGIMLLIIFTPAFFGIFWYALGCKPHQVVPS